MGQDSMRVGALLAKTACGWGPCWPRQHAGRGPVGQDSMRVGALLAKTACVGGALLAKTARG